MIIANSVLMNSFFIYVYCFVPYYYSIDLFNSIQMVEVKYEIVKSQDSNIIIREFYGVVQAEDVINSFEYIFKKYDIENIDGIATDFDQAKFAMNLKQFQAVLNYINKNPILFKIKMAVIVNTPKKIIFPILAKTMLKKLNIKPFTTRNAAVVWLNT